MASWPVNAFCLGSESLSLAYEQEGKLNDALRLLRQASAEKPRTFGLWPAFWLRTAAWVIVSKGPDSTTIATYLILLGGKCTPEVAQKVWFLILTLFCKLAFLWRIGRALEFNKVPVRVGKRHNPEAVPNKRAFPRLEPA